jgi:hypothetical protein
MYWSIIIIVIVLLCYWVGYYKHAQKHCYYEEFYENNITFLSKNELENILISDNDNFYKKFNKIDFNLRKINNISEYLVKIKNSVNEFTDNEKMEFLKKIKYIDEKISKINLPWLNGQKFANIPWKLGSVIGYEYENGLPHTRGDVIIIPKEYLKKHNFIRTMIHEKVHVYQKLYPEDVDIFLKLNNFKKIRKVVESDMIRVNMDIDDWLYEDKNGNEYKAVFNKNPTDIQDVTFSPCNSQLCEHPFEKMAIEISNI